MKTRSGKGGGSESGLYPPPIKFSLETGPFPTPKNAESGGGGVVSYMTHVPKKDRRGANYFQFSMFPLKNDQKESVL